MAAILSGTLGIALAHPIEVTTSCGKTVTIESSDYSNGAEVVAAALAIESALC